MTKIRDGRMIRTVYGNIKFIKTKEIKKNVRKFAFILVV